MQSSRNQATRWEDRKCRRVLTRRRSFHGGSSTSGGAPAVPDTANRARTLPNLPFDTRVLEESRGKMTKLLLNVTIQGSLGAVQVVMKMESSVSELVAASLAQYVKERRRPVLYTTDPASFTLHYSQFSLDSIDGEEKVKVLGCRNFFLCSRSKSEESCCSKEAAKESYKSGNPWMKLMDFVFRAE